MRGHFSNDGLRYYYNKSKICFVCCNDKCIRNECKMRYVFFFVVIRYKLIGYPIT